MTRSDKIIILNRKPAVNNNSGLSEYKYHLIGEWLHDYINT